jgi:hypothetical protein
LDTLVVVVVVVINDAIDRILLFSLSFASSDAFSPPFGRGNEMVWTEVLHSVICTVYKGTKYCHQK